MSSFGELWKVYGRRYTPFWRGDSTLKCDCETLDFGIREDEAFNSG
jgi:hypothetical protein